MPSFFIGAGRIALIKIKSVGSSNLLSYIIHGLSPFGPLEAYHRLIDLYNKHLFLLVLEAWEVQEQGTRRFGVQQGTNSLPGS